MKLKVESRNITWKHVKKLRKLGKVPATIYGKHLEKPISIACEKNEFVKLFREAGHSTPVILQWDGIEEMVLIHDYQLDPVMDTVLHVDFLWIKKWQKVSAEVSIVLQWEELSPIVKLWQWNIQLVKDALMIESLPKDLPKEIIVDVASLDDVNTVIFVKDLNLPEWVVAKEDLELPVVTVMQLQDEAETVEGNENPAGTANDEATATE